MTDADPNRRPSNFGRYMFLLIFGVVLGVGATIVTPRLWVKFFGESDPFPEALMHVQQWHMGQLKADMDANRCNATDILPHLQALRVTSNDLDAAFPSLRDDTRFTAASSAMRAAADKAIANPPLTCDGLGATMKSIGETCKGCHQDFRS